MWSLLPRKASNLGWLEKSPQYRVPDYNPFEMSKLKLLRDAARINPWGSRYHMWLDSGEPTRPSCCTL